MVLIGIVIIDDNAICIAVCMLGSICDVCGLRRYSNIQWYIEVCSYHAYYMYL